jgi:hypothetical protein
MIWGYWYPHFRKPPFFQWRPDLSHGFSAGYQPMMYPSRKKAIPPWFCCLEKVFTFDPLHARSELLQGAKSEPTWTNEIPMEFTIICFWFVPRCGRLLKVAGDKNFLEAQRWLKPCRSPFLVPHLNLPPSFERGFPSALPKLTNYIML